MDINKRLAGAVMSLGLLMSLGACQKDVPYEEEKKNPDLGEYLVEIVDTTYYETTEDFKNYLAEVMKNNLDPELFSIAFDALFTDNTMELMARMFTHSVNGAQGHIEQYQFLYNSTASNGEPVVLSGVLTLPNYSSDPIFSHVLDNLTIYHEYWKLKDKVVSKNGNPEQIRALFNQAVVISDGEGYGYSEDRSYHPFFSYNALARQSLDCAQAALELIDRLGVKMRDGYKTYNMAMSKGAPVALAMHKMIANSNDDELKEKFDIAGTYCCSGPYDMRSFLEYSLGQESTMASWVAATVAMNTIESSPELFEGKESEIFSEEFLSARHEFNGQTMSLTEILDTREAYQDVLNPSYEDCGITSIEKVFNRNFFREDGTFDEDNALVKEFLEAVEEENPTAGWTPDAPVLFEHSTDDQFVIYDVTIKNYSELKYNQGFPNVLVRQHTYSELDHDTMSILGMVRMGTLEDPSQSIALNLAF